ncbi:MAG: synthase, partial [Gaiellales bacterium]|nr:synthase [Gaiellales bacterium]
MLSDADALALAELPLDEGLDDLLAAARRVRDEHFGIRVTYSPKVFIPLTMLCRDVCHYCTFARP